MPVRFSHIPGSINTGLSRRGIIKIMPAVFFIFAAIPVLTAQQSQTAVLEKGPVYHRGIEFLGMNAIQSWYGEYSAKEDLIIIYYTDSEIVLSGDWEAGGCGIDGSFSGGTAADGRPRAAYRDPRGWTAFFSYTMGQQEFCSFLGVYISRQNYFINIVRDKSLFSFPAVIEFGN